MVTAAITASVLTACGEGNQTVYTVNPPAPKTALATPTTPKPTATIHLPPGQVTDLWLEWSSSDIVDVTRGYYSHIKSDGVMKPIPARQALRQDAIVMVGSKCLALFDTNYAAPGNRGVTVRTRFDNSYEKQIQNATPDDANRFIRDQDYDPACA